MYVLGSIVGPRWVSALAWALVAYQNMGTSLVYCQPIFGALLFSTAFRAACVRGPEGLIEHGLWWPTRIWALPWSTAS